MKMGQRENAIMTRLQLLGEGGGGGHLVIETTLLMWVWGGGMR